MALTSAWMADWLMLALKTHTSGPKAATFASGHGEVSAAAAAGALVPAQLVARAAATTAADNAAANFLGTPPRRRARANPDELASRMTAFLSLRRPRRELGNGVTSDPEPAAGHAS